MSGECVISFGKHKGKTYQTIASSDPGYCQWCLRQDNPGATLSHLLSYLKTVPEYSSAKGSGGEGVEGVQPSCSSQQSQPILYSSQPTSHSVSSPQTRLNTSQHSGLTSPQLPFAAVGRPSHSPAVYATAETQHTTYAHITPQANPTPCANAPPNTHATPQTQPPRHTYPTTHSLPTPQPAHVLRHGYNHHSPGLTPTPSPSPQPPARILPPSSSPATHLSHPARPAYHTRPPTDPAYPTRPSVSAVGAPDAHRTSALQSQLNQGDPRQPSSCIAHHHPTHDTLPPHPPHSSNADGTQAQTVTSSLDVFQFKGIGGHPLASNSSTSLRTTATLPTSESTSPAPAPAPAPKRPPPRRMSGPQWASEYSFQLTDNPNDTHPTKAVDHATAHTGAPMRPHNAHLPHFTHPIPAHSQQPPGTFPPFHHDDRLAQCLDRQAITRVPLDGPISIELASLTHFRCLSTYRKKLATFLPKPLYSYLMTLSPTIVPGERGSTSLNLPAGAYQSTLKALSERFEAPVEAIPDFVLRAFDAFSVYTPAVRIPKKTANILLGVTSPITSRKAKDVKTLLGDTLQQGLRPFQIEGIEYGLKRNGRVLIGDEMGLGKTLQALGVAAFYHDEWPLLVVCPSSIRFQWKDQALRWLPHIVSIDDVCVVKNGKSVIPPQSKIIVISYDLLTKNERFHSQAYKVVVVDESHYIKSTTAKRTQILTPLLRSARRAMLLSGTPALNKPTELYTQLSALLPEFATYDEFASRFADKVQNPWSRRTEYQGSRHAEELHLLLKNSVMIRRLKKEVQKELPPKVRSRVPVEVDEKEMKEIKRLMGQLKSLESDMKAASETASIDVSDNQFTLDGPQKNNKVLVTELFTLTGRAKAKAAAEYVSYLIQNDCKFLVFGHHIEVLDVIEQQVIKDKVDYVRIDGRTPQDHRESLVKKFQQRSECQVAILSITACGQGLDLTAAGTVVFAELYWVPGQMMQAEDRAHRMGTEYSTIDVHYLVAEDTIDETVWKTLNKKWGSMTSTLDGREQAIEADSLSKGRTGRVAQLTDVVADCQNRKRMRENREKGNRAPSTSLKAQKRKRRTLITSSPSSGDVSDLSELSELSESCEKPERTEVEQKSITSFFAPL
eukprot:GHVN01080007.1.p1 GENE.GHVN01080007.1~~GHVN01080007.1.p1  ORF type:complete len:1122 (-),score=226.22 GHVN01080007.1:78-3443(-)